MACRSLYYLAIGLLIIDFVVSLIQRGSNAIEASSLVKRDRPICNVSFGRPRKSDCDAAIALIASSDELATITTGLADASLDQHTAAWTAQQFGNCLVVASLMHQVNPDSISLNAIETEGAAISEACVGQLGVGGTSTHQGVHDNMFVALFWKNPNVSRLPHADKTWTRSVWECMRRVVRDVMTNLFNTENIDLRLNNGESGTDCGPLAMDCNVDGGCCRGYACTTRSVLSRLILYGKQVMAPGGVKTCLAPQSTAKFTPRVMIEGATTEGSKLDKRSIAGSWMESPAGILQHSPASDMPIGTRFTRRERSHPWPLNARSNLVKRASCNAMYGSPTSSHCARAFQLLPNPTSSTNAEIQFVSDPVDAPVDSPIFQLPTFYAFGDCRIGIMNYDTGTSETIEEFATWASIRAAIGRVMTECVVEPQMEGGTERTGRDNEIAVYVYEVRSLFYWRINDLTFANAISDSNLEDIEPENINPVVPMGQAGVQQAVPPSPFSSWTSFTRGHSCYTSYCKVNGDCCQAFQCVQKAWTSVIDLVMFGASAIFSGGGSICSFSGA